MKHPKIRMMSNKACMPSEMSEMDPEAKEKHMEVLLTKKVAIMTAMKRFSSARWVLSWSSFMCMGLACWS